MTKPKERKLFGLLKYHSPFEHPLLLAAGSVVLIVFFGSLGYCLIEGWSINDALYMTVITLSTVGFGEVQTLSPEGRLFTAALIIAGVGVATYSFTTIVRAIVEGELTRLRGAQRMKKKIAGLRNHTIVCGFGRLGRIVVRELLEAGKDAVVVEVEPKAIEELERSGISYIEGSAYEDEVLRTAGIEYAESLLSLLPKDADNVYVTLCARDLNPDLSIVSRTEDDDGEKRLRRAGANQVVAPYRVSGNRIVQRLIRPNVSDFLELAAGRGAQQLAIEEIVVNNTSPLVGKTLAESNLPKETGAIIAAIISGGGEMSFNPGATSIIEGGATLIVLGHKESLEKLSTLL
jgi:voltage-gated potassium channel